MTGQKWSGGHRRLSEQIRAHALGQICHFCGLPMLPGQPLDLDHAPDGRSYRGVTHRYCNRADGARKSLAIQRARRGQRRRRFIMRNEVALGVEIAIDRGHTSIVRAGRGTDGRIIVELAAYVPGTDHSSTICNMVASQGKHRVLAVMLDPRSPAATLLEPLRLLRVDVTEASTHVVSAAHGCFLDELREGRLAIEKHPQLDTAAKYAMSRQLAGGEALERRKPIVHTCRVLAAELAVWGVLHAVRSVPRIHVFKATEDGGGEEGSGRGTAHG